MMSKVAAAAVVLGAVVAGCGGLTSAGPKTGHASPPQALSAQAEYLFQADREWNRAAAVNFPADELSESDYQPVTTGAAYSVRFPAEATRVEILPVDASAPYRGTRTGTDADRERFELDEGTFAGGRFVVWSAGDTHQAELTLYGSGLPVVRSMRGRLTQVVPQ